MSSAGSSISHGDGIIEEFWDSKLIEEKIFGVEKHPDKWMIT